MSGAKDRKRPLKSAGVQAELRGVWELLPRRRDRLDAVVLHALLAAACHELRLRQLRALLDPAWAADLIPATSSVDFETFARVVFARVEQAVDTSSGEGAVLTLLKRARSVTQEMCPIVLDVQWGCAAESAPWFAFPHDVSAALESRYCAGAELCIVDLPQGAFVLDFATLTMVSEDDEADAAGPAIAVQCRVTVNKEASFHGRRTELDRKRAQAAGEAAKRAEAARGVISDRPLSAGQTAIWEFRITDRFHALPLRLMCLFELRWRQAIRSPDTESFTVAVGAGPEPRIYTVRLNDPLLGAVVSDSGGGTTSISRRVVSASSSPELRLRVGPTEQHVVSLGALQAKLMSTPVALTLLTISTEVQQASPPLTLMLCDFISKGSCTIDSAASAAQVVDTLEQLVVVHGVPAAAIRIAGFYPNRRHELLFARHWTPLCDVNEWLFNAGHHSALLQGRWVPMAVGEMAVLLEGEWCWLRTCGTSPSENVRFLCDGDPLTVPRTLLDRTAFPSKFCPVTDVVVIADWSAQKLRKALDIFATLCNPVRGTNVATLEAHALHLTHAFTFLGINIAAAITSAKMKLAIPLDSLGDALQRQLGDIAQVASVSDAIDDEEDSSDEGTSSDSSAAAGYITATPRNEAINSHQQDSIAAVAQEASTPRGTPAPSPSSVPPHTAPKLRDCELTPPSITSKAVPRRWMHVLESPHAGIHDALLRAESPAAAQTLDNKRRSDYRPPRKRPTGSFEYRVQFQFDV